MPALETFRLVPFRVENSDQGLEMVAKVTSLIELKVKRKAVDIKLNSEHPIRNPLKDMDTRFPQTASVIKALHHKFANETCLFFNIETEPV